MSIDTTTVYKVNTGARTETIMTPATFTARTTTTTYGPGAMYRDIGKYVITVDATGKHIAKYAFVQLIDGPQTEGVPDNYSTTEKFYVAVWAAEPATTRVNVARTG
jgi:hypothetical protein